MLEVAGKCTFSVWTSPFAALVRGLRCRSARPPATPRKGHHEPTERSHVRRLLLPPSRPVRDGTGASVSHLPRRDAHAPAAAPAAPRSARGFGSRGRVNDAGRVGTHSTRPGRARTSPYPNVPAGAVDEARAARNPGGVRD